MHQSNGMIQYRSPAPDFLKVSHDGYVRMPLYVLMELPLTHFLSGLDDDPAHESKLGVTQSSISGYTEWLSDSDPMISIGWDWHLSFITGAPRYLRDGWPRSNIMIVDTRSGSDAGDAVTAESIVSRISRIGWEDEVRKQIAARYA